MIFKAELHAATGENFFCASAQIHKCSTFTEKAESIDFIQRFLDKISGDSSWRVRAEVRVFSSGFSGKPRLVWKYSTRRKLSLKKPEWANLPVLEIPQS
jgi:predicted secreted protein